MILQPILAVLRTGVNVCAGNLATGDRGQAEARSVRGRTEGYGAPGWAIPWPVSLAGAAVVNGAAASAAKLVPAAARPVAAAASPRQAARQQPGAAGSLYIGHALQATGEKGIAHSCHNKSRLFSKPPPTGWPTSRLAVSTNGTLSWWALHVHLRVSLGERLWTTDLIWAETCANISS